MTLLVIAGAGASYDSSREFPIEGNGRYAVSADFEYYRPPLAKDLFEWHPSETPYFEAIARYPRAAPAVDRLRAWVQEGISVEDGLGRLSDERFLGSEANAQLAAIRYYLRWTIGGVEERWHKELNHVTNYLTLIDRLARHYHETARATPVRIVTFNYDTLIERALTDVLHARFGTIEDYTSRPDFQLFKPHGSVNWLRKAAVHSDDWQRLRSYGDDGGVQAENDVIELSQLATIQPVRNHYAIRDWAGPIDTSDRSGSTAIWIPALAIPTVHKQEYEAPAVHIEHMRVAIAEATEVLVIGWRGAERHFLRLLHETIRHSTPVTVVAESEDAAKHTVDQLWPTSKFNRYRLLGSCFSGLFSARPGESEAAIDLVLAGKAPWVERDPEVGDFSEEPIEHVDLP